MLTDDELIELIDNHESERTEFTESTTDLEKFRKAICAFSNDLPASGKPGVLFIGIADDKTCANLRIDTALLEKLGGLRKDGKILPFPVMSVEARTLNGCKIAVIQVEPSDNTPMKVDSRCWVRVGPRTEQASASEERLLTEKRQLRDVSYDMQEVRGASVEADLDMRKFESEYLPYAVSPEMLAKNQRSVFDQLRTSRLVTSEGIPTVTAILMLGNDPAQWFPGAYIQFVRFDGDEVTDSVVDQKEIRGTLPDQLRELGSLLKLNIQDSLDISGAKHIASPNFPERALRELAHNAVIHRDYQDNNAPVRIYWFSGSIEIISPGSIHGGLRVEDLGKPMITAYRNPTISAAMKNLGFMESFGFGISAAREALRENGNPEPEFRVEGNFVFVKIKRQP